VIIRWLSDRSSRRIMEGKRVEPEPQLREMGDGK
jgi:hypothetical protein